MTRTLVRRTVLLGVAAMAAVSLAACGDSSDSSSSPMSGMNQTSAAATASADAAFNDADVSFAQGMIPHHQQAVEMAKLAATRASGADVKKLAQQIEAAQGPEITTMTGWLTAWGKPTAAPSMGNMNTADGGMPGMMSDADMTKLKAASGAAFDKQFLTMMIAHHQGAITMSKDELAKGSNSDAKTLAQKIITAQQAEIDTMNGLLG